MGHTPARSHSIDPKSLPARSSRRRPGEMPYFREVEPKLDETIQLSTESRAAVAVNRHTTSAFASSARITHDAGAHNAE